MRSHLKKRHQSGLRQAKALANILKTEFGATKVALFGSMLCADDVRMGSDIDLAVWNLPIKKYIAALSRLTEMTKEFQIDLVRIEEAPPSLFAYISKDGLTLEPGMSCPKSIVSTDRPMPSYKPLISRIRRALGDLEAEYEYAQTQAKLARETKQDVYWTAVGLSLHGFYTGLEKTFQQIADKVDGGFSSKSEQWHKELLDQMTLDLPGVRPPVIDQEACRYLQKHLMFRHVIRSNYTHRLEPEGIIENFERLEDGYQLISKQLEDFCNFLTSVD